MTHDEAIARARGLAEARGWTWRLPVRVTVHRSFFVGRERLSVRSNADSFGGNVVVELDAETAEVLRAAYLPR